MNRQTTTRWNTYDSIGYSFIGFVVGFFVGTITTIFVMSTIMANKPKKEVTEVRPIVVTVYPQKPQDVTKTIDELLKRRPILPTFNGDR